MIGFNQRGNVLVTSGDLAMFTKNNAVWTLVNGKAKLAVPEGQIFAMDVKTLQSVDGTSSLVNPIKIGIALAENKVRWLTGEEFYPKYTKAITVGKPKCGSPEVVDLTWLCTECEEYYGITVRVRDNDTMSWQNSKTDGQPYFADARVNCETACGDCNPTASCTAVQDSLVTALNEAFEENEVKAFATKLYASSQVYCFTYSADVCGDSCTVFNGVSSVKVGQTTYGTLTTVGTAATTSELMTKLQLIADDLNADVDWDGSAFVTGGYAGQDCCVQLHINSAAAVTIKDEAQSPNTYVACDSPINADIATKCGIRVIGSSVAENLECILTKDKGFYGRYIDLYATTDSFVDATITKVSELTLPQNYGLFVRYQEYNQAIGGQGRNYSSVNTFLKDGLGFNLVGDSRAKNSFTYSDAALSYVGISFEHGAPHANHNSFNELNPTPSTSTIYIPECDSTTLTSVQTFVNTIATTAGLPAVINISGNVLETGETII